MNGLKQDNEYIEESDKEEEAEQLTSSEMTDLLSHLEEYTPTVILCFIHRTPYNFLLWYYKGIKV